MWVTYGACAVTLGLALYAVWMIGLVVARHAEELAEETLWQKFKAIVTGKEEIGTTPPSVGAPPVRETSPAVTV
jgi:hypothetical protein